MIRAVSLLPLLVALLMVAGMAAPSAAGEDVTSHIHGFEGMKAEIVARTQDGDTGVGLRGHSWVLTYTGALPDGEDARVDLALEPADAFSLTRMSAIRYRATLREPQALFDSVTSFRRTIRLRAAIGAAASTRSLGTGRCGVAVEFKTNTDAPVAVERLVKQGLFDYETRPREAKDMWVQAAGASGSYVIFTRLPDHSDAVVDVQAIFRGAGETFRSQWVKVGFCADAPLTHAATLSPPVVEKAPVLEVQQEIRTRYIERPSKINPWLLASGIAAGVIGGTVMALGSDDGALVGGGLTLGLSGTLIGLSF